MREPALDALFWALQNISSNGPPKNTLFLRARACAELREFSNLICVQGFKPLSDELMAWNYAVHATLEEALAAEGAQRFDQILLLPARQRTETRAQLAHAALHLAEGGTLIAAQLNDEGARSLQSDCEALFGVVRWQSKFKSRVIFCTPARAGDASAGDRQLDRELAQAWLAADAPTPIVGGHVVCLGKQANGEGVLPWQNLKLEFISRPGVFAWDRIDVGSALLAQHLPRDFAGYGADLGCGFGFLAAHILAHSPGVVGMDCYEADSRALELARRNLAPLATSAERQFFWHDVQRGLLRKDYDFIVSNPPFHTSRADQVALGMRFLKAAAAALRPQGQFYLVANQHLAYEATLSQDFSHVDVLATEQGFKVLKAVR
jgi:16S rRNA (guanine1207-N2)-methyltransferase